MTVESFIAWRKQRGLSARQAAFALGIHANTVYRWEQGDHSEDVPLYIALACGAISYGLPPHP